MAGGQTLRYMICGKSGSGKSTYARAVVAALSGKYSQLVVVNRKREFEDLCEKHYTVDEDGDPSAALDQHASVFFHVVGADPRPFLNKLGAAIMKHGRRNVLVLMDESYEFLLRGRLPKGFFRVITGGREFGHHLVFVTQDVKSEAAIDPAVMNQLTHLAVLHTQGNNLDRIKSYFPELGDEAQHLAPADEPKGAPPEVAVKNRNNHNAVVRLRRRDDPYTLVERNISRDSSRAAFSETR